MTTPLTVGSLFSGIGGFDLGFERAGFDIRWMCEINPSCRNELAKHWPEVPIYEDVRSIRGSAGDGSLVSDPPIRGVEKQRLSAEGKISLGYVDGTREEVEPVDVLIGGFPCQDISLAGKGAGLNGARSSLWWEFYRLIGELRPRYVCLENVAALIVRGLPAILGALSTLGYDAEWQIVSAASLGAPHLRERLFVVAYPQRGDDRRKEQCCKAGRANTIGSTGGPCRSSEDVADALSPRLEIVERQSKDDGAQQPSVERNDNEWQYWAVEPPVGRVAHGISRRVDRLRALGNAVVPQVAEYVARCIQRHAEANPATDIGG